MKKPNLENIGRRFGRLVAVEYVGVNSRSPCISTNPMHRAHAGRSEVRLTPQQFRAAKELLPYEQPKLTAVALGHFDGTWFAAALERATLRSQQPPPRAALSAPEQHPASELKGNFPMRRRNLR
jgi:hypothetical protein